MSSAQEHMSSAQEQSARVGGSAQGEAASQYVPRPSAGYDDKARYTDEGPSGAALGMTMFAAVLLMVSGLWNFLEGLAAIIKGQFFIVLPNYAFNVSVTSWGWWHLIMGVVVFAAGVCLFTDMMWARIAGVVVATVSAISNFLYIPYFPVWSIVLIAIDVFVIWALMTPRHARR